MWSWNEKKNLLNNFKYFQIWFTQLQLVYVQAFGGDDSDVGTPRKNHVAAESSSLPNDPVQSRDHSVQFTEQQNRQWKGNENAINDVDLPSALPVGESYRSMGEILSSMDPAAASPLSVVESAGEKSASKATPSNANGKRSTFWGRNNVCIYLLMRSLLTSWIIYLIFSSSPQLGG